MVKAKNQTPATSAKVSATPTTAVQAIIAEQLYDLQGRPAISSDVAIKGMSGSTSPATYPNQIGFEAGFITDRSPAPPVSGDFWTTPGGSMEGQITSWVDQSVYTDNNHNYAYSGQYYETDPTSRVTKVSSSGEQFLANTPQAPEYAYGQYDILPVDGSTISVRTNINNALSNALNSPGPQSKNAYQTMVTRIPLSSEDPDNNSLFQISMNEIAGGAGFNLSIDTKNNFLLSSTQYRVNSMLSEAVGNHIVRSIQHKYPNYYDSTGNIADSDKASFQMQTEIDALGRTTYSKGPDDQGKRVYYDAGGLLRFSQDADQAQVMTCLYYVYDGMGRLIRISGLTLTTIWDTTTLQGYLDKSIAMPDTKDLRIYTYDVITDSNLIPLFSNILGRLAQVDSWNCPMDLNASNSYNYANSQVREIYIYDGRGRLARRQLYYTDQSSDPKVLENVDNFNYTYNNLSQVTQIAGSLDNDYTVNYQYNLQGLLSSVSDASNPTNTYVQYVYNADGTLNSNTMPITGYQTSYTYNTIKQLTDMLLIQSSDSNKIFDEKLSYSNNGSYSDGNLTSAYSSYNSAIGAQNFVYKYTYDSFKRLASAIASPANNSTSVMPSWNIVDTDTIKGYDSNGNIWKSSTGLPGQMTTSSDYYNPGTNQLNNINNGSSRYYYTPSGRVSYTNPMGPTDNDNPIMSATSVQNLNFTYDILLGRPIGISNGNGNDYTTIIYDAAGERIFKSTNNMTIQYYRHGPQVLYEQLSYTVDEPVNYIANYYYGLSGIVGGTYKRSGDTSVSTYNSIVDHLGSTRLIIDPNSAAITYFNYDTWGNLVTSVEGQSGNSSDGAGQESPALYAGVTRYLYTGQEWDAETQLYNYHARQYDPSSYRFLTPDPMYQYTNPYSYVANNPVNMVDPTGMAWWSGLANSISKIGNKLSNTIFNAEELLPHNTFDSLVSREQHLREITADINIRAPNNEQINPFRFRIDNNNLQDLRSLTKGEGRVAIIDLGTTQAEAIWTNNDTANVSREMMYFGSQHPRLDLPLDQPFGWSKHRFEYERGFGSSHAQLARNMYGDVAGATTLYERIRIVTGSGPRATYPDLEGFAINISNQGQLLVNFNSATLNETVANGNRGYLKSINRRLEIILVLKRYINLPLAVSPRHKGNISPEELALYAILNNLG